VIIILFFQLIYGALMAGHKAANVASTWPTINGQWIPMGLSGKDSFLLNAVNNTIWIHFVHRGIAYLLLAIIIYWVLQMKQIKSNSFWEKVKSIYFINITLNRFLPPTFKLIHWICST
jgi:cytochrome c oxidase assembly protein subunit 15